MVDEVLDTAAEAVKVILTEGPAAAMNRFNRKAGSQREVSGGIRAELSQIRGVPANVYTEFWRESMNRTYELMFIVRPDMAEEDQDKLISTLDTALHPRAER